MYDLEVSANCHNFCLGNGVVVHNSKDLSDSVAGAVQNLYLNLDTAGKLSNQYIAKTSAEQLAKRGTRPTDRFQEMMNSIYN